MTPERLELIKKMQLENSSDKYFEELDFLLGLIRPYYGEKVIDFGCGVGTAVKYYRNIVDHVNFIGYDIEPYMTDLNPYAIRYFTKELIPCDTIYFFNSFELVEDINELMPYLKTKVKKRIIIVMDNWSYQKSSGFFDKKRNLQTLRNLIETFKGFKIIVSGQFGNLDTLGNCEKIFLVVKP